MGRAGVNSSQSVIIRLPSQELFRHDSPSRRRTRGVLLSPIASAVCACQVRGALLHTVVCRITRYAKRNPLHWLQSLILWKPKESLPCSSRHNSYVQDATVIVMVSSDNNITGTIHFPPKLSCIAIWRRVEVAMRFATRRDRGLVRAFESPSLRIVAQNCLAVQALPSEGSRFSRRAHEQYVACKTPVRREVPAGG